MVDEWIPAAKSKFGNPADDRKNREFVKEWQEAKRGTRRTIAEKYGFSSYDVAKVIYYNLVRHGKTSGRTRRLDTGPDAD